MRFLALLALAFAISGCTKKQETPEPSSAAPAPTLQPAAPAPRELDPTFELARQCISGCRTVSARSQDMATPGVENALPKDFSALVSDPAYGEKFTALVKQFPEPLWPLGILQPSDEPGTVNYGIFGSSKKEAPLLLGGLSNVLDYSGRSIHIYTGVQFNRVVRLVSASATVAVDPSSGEMAAIIREGENLDNYYLRGSDSVKPALIALRVADDLAFAKQLLFYAQRRKDSSEVYHADPITFPLSQNADEAKDRVALLSDSLAKTGVALRVSPPADSQKAAQAIQDATWYSVSQGRDACVENPSSPADRIERIQASGLRPVIKEEARSGKPVYVEISVTDGGYESTWRFWKHRAECIAALPAKIDLDRYR